MKNSRHREERHVMTAQTGITLHTFLPTQHMNKPKCRSVKMSNNKVTLASELPRQGISDLEIIVCREKTDHSTCKQQ